MQRFKTAIFIIAIFGIILFSYKLLFIRTVNYEVAGIMIPCKYNILTSNIKPIPNYKGKRNLPVISNLKAGKIGLSDVQVASAQIRWAVFEEWIKKHPEYKGWESNPETFKIANEAFRKEFESHTRVVEIK